MTNIIDIRGIEDAGIEVHIAQIDRGFSVAIKDTDAGLFVGVAKIFPTEAAARKFAATIN